MINKMILNQFGKVFGGSCKFLDVTPMKRCHPSSFSEIDHYHLLTMKAIVKSLTCLTSVKADHERLDYFKEESIGVHCEP